MNYNSVIGRWEGVHMKYKVIYKFHIDGNCEFLYLNSESDTIDFVQGQYELNLTKNPQTLSVWKIPTLNHPLHTIVKIEDTEQIRLANFAPKWRIRPITFNEKTDITLKRKKIQKGEL